MISGVAAFKRRRKIFALLHPDPVNRVLLFLWYYEL